MTARLPRYARLRAGLLGTLALAALASACETPLPSSSEVEKMDVAAVEAHARQLELMTSGGETTYFVDGKQATAEEARALSGDRIARVDVSRAPNAAGGVIHLHTRVEAADQPATGERVQVAVRAPTASGETRTEVAMRPGDRFEGLLIVDGVITESTALGRMHPDQIERIDVMKGEAATRAYDDPRAAHGVIRITTKRAAGSQ